MEPNNPIQPPVFNQPAQQPQYQQPQYPQQPYYGLPQMKPQMGFVEAIKTVLIEKYCCFKGRARRSEYWNWQLAYFLLSVVLSVFNTFMMFSRIETLDLDDPFSLYKSPGYIVMAIVMLALILPNLGVTVRRLHDTGHSGLWVLSPLVFYFPMLWISLSIKSHSGSSMGGWIAIMALCLIALLAICIILIVWLCRDSDPRENQYGPSPKYSA
jgi:uncharacterized membrane protein YhaH (DUF805 family)